jgi:hypothetical protein
MLRFANRRNFCTAHGNERGETEVGKELISKATRNEFREALVGFVLREIVDIFNVAEIEARTDFEPQPFLSGQRRNLVERYYASINFRSCADVRKVTSAFEEVIERLEQIKGSVVDPALIGQTISNLVRRMERDGFDYQNGHFISESLRLVAIDTRAITESCGSGAGMKEAAYPSA